MSEEKDISESERLLDQIRHAGRMTREDREELKAVLGNKSVQRALHEVLVTADAKAYILLGMDLVSNEGRVQASRVQTEAQTLSGVVEMLVEFATTELEEE